MTDSFPCRKTIIVVPRKRGPITTGVDGDRWRLPHCLIETARRMGPAFAGTTSWLLQRLQFVVLGLRPAGARGSIIVQRDRRLAEGLAIGLDHGLAELLEF